MAVKDYKQYQAWYDGCGAVGVPYFQLIPALKVGAAASLPDPKAPAAPATAATPASALRP